jgi:tetratricopeptide (TPR) repeat protein
MTKPLLTLGLVVTISVLSSAQAPEPPIADTRVAVQTLVREDIFAGFLQGNVVRLARAEKNLDSLLASRPAARAEILAWQGSIALTHAAIAHEANQPARFDEQYKRARALFSEAAAAGPNNDGVIAITGGSLLMIADRLPAAERAQAWQHAYESYQSLWKSQGAVIEKLPLHHRGEVLAGLAQSAQRTGRTGEIDAQLDRMLSLLPNSNYAKQAQVWKDDPSARANAKLACQSCHAPGTLNARLAELNK